METPLRDQDAGAVAYTLKRSSRRRRTISLSVDPMQGLVVAAPAKTPTREIDAFVKAKTRWIQKAQAGARDRERQLRRSFATGESIPYLGGTLTLRIVEADRAARPTVECVGTCLDVRLAASTSECERGSLIRTTIEGWYKARAEATIAERVRSLAPLAGVQPKRVIVKSQKTRWGSCGKDGTLYFSWQLVIAPLPVLDYLVVHELCHLRQAGHGKRFWALVEAVLHDYQARRAELRHDGWRYRIC